ncbi:MAG: cell division protein FtsW [Candidatus Harrisonbacteria bacterium]|nr:cell division protein FtsW [Candidatus Harrisonbacteria bacterium]
MPAPLATYDTRNTPDYLVVFCALFLVAFGVLMLASASSDLGNMRFGDSYYYVKHQMLYGLSIGILGFLFAARQYYGAYRKIALPLLLVSVAGVALVFSPLGIRSGGAERWLSIGAIAFQPAELLKLALVIYLAAWLGNAPDRPQTVRRGLLPFVLVLGAIGAILLAQSTTSTFVILAATACIMYFASGARIPYLVLTMIAGAAAMLLVSYFTPYRWDRITAYMNPEANVQSSGYHLDQARIAIGSGGLWGVGLGESTTKIRYLPEPIGDSIFAVIAEELGFVGAATVALLFGTLGVRTLLLARRVQNRFGELLLVGFGSVIGIQAFIHIGAISGLTPLTGMPLPFISYGGTSLAVFMTMAGIIVNISKHTV